MGVRCLISWPITFLLLLECDDHYLPGLQSVIVPFQSVCYDSPVVKDVLREVVMKLPQPYEVCITKEIALPRVKCNQVHDLSINITF